jgi:hypothetical protein
MNSSSPKPHKKNKKNKKRHSTGGSAAPTAPEHAEADDRRKSTGTLRTPKQLSEGLKGLRFMARKTDSRNIASAGPETAEALAGGGSAPARLEASLSVLVPHMNLAVPVPIPGVRCIPAAADDTDSAAELRLRQGAAIAARRAWNAGQGSAPAAMAPAAPFVYGKRARVGA